MLFYFLYGTLLIFTCVSRRTTKTATTATAKRKQILRCQELTSTKNWDRLHHDAHKKRRGREGERRHPCLSLRRHEINTRTHTPMDHSFDDIFAVLETATRLDESKSNRIEAATKVRDETRPRTAQTRFGEISSASTFLTFSNSLLTSVL